MRNHTPYFTTARFDSVCPETGKPITKGDTCAYYPAVKKAYHESSASADNLRGLEFSNAYNMADSGY